MCLPHSLITQASSFVPCCVICLLRNVQAAQEQVAELEKKLASQQASAGAARRDFERQKADKDARIRQLEQDLAAATEAAAAAAKEGKQRAKEAQVGAQQAAAQAKQAAQAALDHGLAQAAAVGAEAAQAVKEMMEGWAAARAEAEAQLAQVAVQVVELKQAVGGVRPALVSEMATLRQVGVQ